MFDLSQYLPFEAFVMVWFAAMAGVSYLVNRKGN